MPPVKHTVRTRQIVRPAVPSSRGKRMPARPARARRATLAAAVGALTAVLAGPAVGAQGSTTSQPPVPAAHAAASYFQLVAAHSGGRMEVRFGVKDDHARIIQSTGKGSTYLPSHWEFLKVPGFGGSYWTVKNRHSGKCLDVSGASQGGHVRVFTIQYECHGGLNQQFGFQSVGGGKFAMYARHSLRYLEVRLGATGNDVPLMQSTSPVTLSGPTEPWRWFQAQPV